MEIFPLAYFGSICYFRELTRAKNPVFEVHEHFIKQSLRTRCRILGANGIQNLSIPVIRPFGSKTPMSEVTISPDKRWRKEHWRSIESAYSAAPYFEFYDKEIRSMIELNTLSLSELNLHITQELLKLIDVQIKIEVTDEYLSTYRIDHRVKNEIGCTEQSSYIQVFGQEFSSNLSFLDLLFCEGPLARNFILTR